ncbi:hypothetical protein MD484_g2758, partial [Candolleomyces efflorescens]
MLRRLEKGLNTAKLKSQPPEASPAVYPPPELHGPPPAQDAYPGIPSQEAAYASPQGTSQYIPGSIPPINIPSYQNGADSYPSGSNGNRNIDPDEEDDDDADKNEDSFYPAKLIKRENQRNSFFRTILNPEEVPTAGSPTQHGGQHPNNHHPRVQPSPPGPLDPISSGILTEEDAKMLFDLLFLRLNPFINLFDPALHTAPYVRHKCPFLFTTLIMVCCKFWRPNLFRTTQKLANDFAVRAFAEAWKRVEVVQAFACLTYWKDPDDNRTWTYIGYACRMAVELGLTRFISHPVPNETDLQKLERRNRERTYLVLFVHDRSLSTQTGRHWMLPEGELVKHSTTWHTGGIKGIAETTDIFASNKGNTDIDYAQVLRKCNDKLTTWDETWRAEMVKAKGETFHLSFLSFFRLYVRLFLNSFGIQASLIPGSRTPPSLQALTTCYTSALDSLRIVSDDFVKMSMLCYGQDSITVMTAYSAVFLLRLLQTPITFAQIGETVASDIYRLIHKTADSYYDASHLSPVATSAAYHARFLHSLLANDIFRSRRTDRERNDNGMPIDPRLQNQGPQQVVQPSPTQASYPHQVPRSQDQGFQFPASPNMPAHPHAGMGPNVYQQQIPQQQQQQQQPQAQSGQQQQQQQHQQEYVVAQQQAVNNAANMNYYSNTHPNLPAATHHASELDAHYWKNMFIELGFGENNETQTNVLAVGTSDLRNAPYMEHPTVHHHQPPQHNMHQGPIPYHSSVHPPMQVSVHPQYNH